MAQETAAVAVGLGPHPSRKEIIAHWDPENEAFWKAYGKKTATRNLVVSIIALLITFCINTLAAQVSAQLNNAGFSFDAGQLFLLFFDGDAAVLQVRAWWALPAASSTPTCPRAWAGATSRS